MATTSSQIATTFFLGEIIKDYSCLTEKIKREAIASPFADNQMYTT